MRACHREWASRTYLCEERTVKEYCPRDLILEHDHVFFVGLNVSIDIYLYEHMYTHVSVHGQDANVCIRCTNMYIYDIIYIYVYIYVRTYMYIHETYTNTQYRRTYTTKDMHDHLRLARQYRAAWMRHVTYRWGIRTAISLFITSRRHPQSGAVQRPLRSCGVGTCVACRSLYMRVMWVNVADIFAWWICMLRFAEDTHTHISFWSLVFLWMLDASQESWWSASLSLHVGTMYDRCVCHWSAATCITVSLRATVCQG